MARVYGSLYKKVAEIEEQVKRLVKPKDFHIFVVQGNRHYNLKTRGKGKRVNHKEINKLPGLKFLVNVGNGFIPTTAEKNLTEQVARVARGNK